MFQDIAEMDAAEFSDVPMSSSPPQAHAQAAPAPAPPKSLSAPGASAGRVDDVMAVVEGKEAGGLDWTSGLDVALATAVRATEAMGRVRLPPYSLPPADPLEHATEPLELDGGASIRSRSGGSGSPSSCRGMPAGALALSAGSGGCNLSRAAPPQPSWPAPLPSRRGVQPLEAQRPGRRRWWRPGRRAFGRRRKTGSCASWCAALRLSSSGARALPAQLTSIGCAGPQSPGGWGRAAGAAMGGGGGSRRRDCHSAAPPSTSCRCFNMDGEGTSE